LHHLAAEIEDRNHQRTYEVLMPALLPKDAQLLQTPALAGTLDAVLVRQMVIQRAVGKAQPEVLQHLRRLQAALEEILLRSRRLLQCCVIVIDHNTQQFLIVRARLKQWRQFGHRADFRRRGCARSGGRKIVAFQQLQRVAEADAFGPLHPLDHVAAFAAGALAAPNIFHRVDVEARLGVFVERAQPD
jgi:hypothetical protein